VDCVLRLYKTRIISLGVLGATLAILSVVYLIRQPAATPEIRGERLAWDLGCFACHGHGGLLGSGNPGAKRHRVPGFNAGASIMSYVYNEQEIREWILYGAPKRLWKGGKPDRQRGIAGGVIKMPGYEHLVTDRDVDDLVAYFKSIAGIELPVPERARRGRDVAEKAGCFGCHGNDGKGGFPNPRSFKGYIPPFNGDDYARLVLDEHELREWILDGSIERFESNPLASFFIGRATIRMPGYRDVLTDTEIEDIITYINWLRDEDRKVQSYWVAPDAPVDEKRLARGAFLYEHTGCVNCHEVVGVGGLSNPNAAGGEVPPVNDLAEKMQIFSQQDNKIFLTMLEDNADLAAYVDEPPFMGYEAVYETFLGTRNLMIKGIVPHKRDPKGPEPPMQMPAWSERTHADDGPVSVSDIDGLISYMLTLQDFTGLEEEIEEEEVRVGAGGFAFPDADYTAQIENYATEFKPLTDVEYSGLHGGRNIEIYINKAKRIYGYNHGVYIEEFERDEDDDDEPDLQYKSYPPGTILLVTHHSPDVQSVQGKAPDFINVMIKEEPGYDEQGHDWRYIKITKRGTVIVDGSSHNYAARVVCSECHRHVAKRDYVFSTYLAD